MDANRTPLGVTPHRIWIKLRIEDLAGAIERYSKAGLPIPQEWITEYNYWLSSDLEGEWRE